MIPQSQLLFIDAYDSFSENIVALLKQQLNVAVSVVRIDAGPESWPSEDFGSFCARFSAIILGPGPGNPSNTNDTGLFNRVWKAAEQGQVPILGVCLGFQSLCTNFGLLISRLDVPCHGHAKHIRHNNEDIFYGVDSVIATNYNSLGVQLTTSPGVTPNISRPLSSASNLSSISSHVSCSLSDHTNEAVIHDLTGMIDPDSALSILAYDDEGYVMAVKHTFLPFWGLQFHPESCKSNVACHTVVQNWWEKVQAHNAEARPNLRRAGQGQTIPKPVALTSTGSQESRHIVLRLQSLMAAKSRNVSSRKLHQTFHRHVLASHLHSSSLPGSVGMLESSRRGRHSIFTVSDVSTWHLQYRRGILSLSKAGVVIEETAMSLKDAMKLVEDLLSANIITEGDPDSPFWGGFIGFYSYEAGLDLLEVSTNDPSERRSVPDFNLMWVDRSIVVDHQENTTTIQSIRPNDDDWIAAITDHMTSSTAESISHTIGHSDLASLPSQSTYVSQIRLCQSSLHAGDSYELCLTTSASIDNMTSPLTLYTSLQQSNPAPYSAYLHLQDTHILSCSPEQFLSWSRTSPHLDMMPMKGTLAKTSTVNTLEKARTILLSPKEEAENLMIADLIRHDLYSALGEAGKVEVVKLFEIVETESLYQLISHIRGYVPSPSRPLLRTAKISKSSDVSNFVSPPEQILRAGHRALRHALPPGSMTGAPKKRSCEILRGLEQRNRGVYSGVIGYFDIGGGGCWSVAIRCAFSQDHDNSKHGQRQSKDVVHKESESRSRTWHVGAGGAITVLSEEQAEWEEMKAKMSSVLKGLGIDA